MTKIYSIWDAGNVNRWHANKYPQLRNSCDTVHAHSARVGLLMEFLFDLSPSYALSHDLPEKALGDIPYGSPKGEEYKNAEAEWFDSYGMICEMTPELHFCDRLDALLWALQHVPNLLRDPEWDTAYESLTKQAVELGVMAEFNELLDAAKKMCHVISGQ